MFAWNQKLIWIFAPVSLGFIVMLPCAFAAPAGAKGNAPAPNASAQRQSDSAQAAQARRTYEEFLKRFPRSPKKREVEESLAELALLQNSNSGDTTARSNPRESSAVARTVGVEDPRPSAPVHSGGKSVASSNSGEIPRIRRIRTSLNGDATRVTIDLEN